MKIIGRYLDLIFLAAAFGSYATGWLVCTCPRTRWQSGQASPATRQPLLTASNTSVGSITADDAVLEFANEPGNNYLKFEIHSVGIKSVAAGSPMNNQLSMRIAEPPGEVESEGTLARG